MGLGFHTDLSSLNFKVMGRTKMDSVILPTTDLLSFAVDDGLFAVYDGLCPLAAAVPKSRLHQDQQHQSKVHHENCHRSLIDNISERQNM